MSDRPRIYPNRHHVAAWMASVERRRDPDGTSINHLLWFQDSVEEEVTYLHRVSTYLAGVEFAGVPPQFLTESHDEPGTALFHLSAPCVLIRWGRTRAGRRLVLEAMVVARRQDYDRVRGKGIALPEPGLVLPTASRLIHLPKRAQQELGQPHPEPLDEARDEPQTNPKGEDSNVDS